MRNDSREVSETCIFYNPTPGSGGAILGLLPDASRFEALRKAYESEGFVVTRVRPNIPQEMHQEQGQEERASSYEEEK